MVCDCYQKIEKGINSLDLDSAIFMFRHGSEETFSTGKRLKKYLLDKIKLFIEEK